MMKFLAAALLLLVATTASAQSISGVSCFEKVPMLAAKLGVHPHTAKDSATLVVPGCNGKNYDLIRMLNALIDKMDRAASKK